jgi:hypothetical protein
MTRQMLLHPMGLMELAVHCLRISLRNLPMLLALAAVLLGPILILMAIGGILLFSAASMEATALRDVLGLILIILSVLGYVTLFGYFYAAVTLAVSLDVIGLKAGPIQILRRLRGTVGIQILGTTFLQSLAVLGGLLLLIIPGIVFFVRFAFAIPVVTLERVAYASAMHRSRELIKGQWWRLFGALLFFLMITYIGSFILGRIFSVPIAMLGVTWKEAYNIGYSLASLVLMPVSFAYPVLLYYDLRIRKEPINIEPIREAV